jgi:putative membrane protein
VGTNYDDNDRNSGSDSAITGLEGTRDQAAQMQADVNMDTSSGQGTTGTTEGQRGTGGLSEGSGSSSNIGATTENQFVSDETAANYGEIKSATLAQKKTSNAEIKGIAAILIRDHTAALNDLKTIGSKKGLTLPTVEPADAKSKMAALETKSGNAFDQAWCEMMMEKHQTTIGKYESVLNSASDQDVKNFISKVLPKIKAHHEKLMAVQGKLKS